MRDIGFGAVFSVCCLVFSCSSRTVADLPQDDNEPQENVCGDDGRRDAEECDGDDLARETCITAGYDGGALACNDDCTYDFSACTGDGPQCGDGDATGFEQCDGNDLRDRDCTDLGYDDGTLACADCTYDTSGCTGEGPECGNNTAEGLEECDGSDLRAETCDSLGLPGDGLTCDNHCRFDTSGCVSTDEPYCGDGEVNQDSEQCDRPDLNDATCGTLGFQGGQLQCTTACQYNTNFCFGSSAECGDGTAEGPEQCDDDDLRSETCQSQGYDGGDLDCQENCSFDVSDCTGDGPECGDGKAEGSEQCDGSDLRDMECEDFGFHGGQLSCDHCEYDFSGCTFMFSPHCGNGIAEGFELCDKDDVRGQTCASVDAGEGDLKCDETCNGYDYSNCSAPPVCGDGDITGDELCDGENLGGFDTCQKFGYSGAGTVRCLPTCKGFDLSECTAPGTCGTPVPGVEQCDGANLRGYSCESLGYACGDLDCHDNCSFDVSGCEPAAQDCH